jgi:hypothetical protein
MNKCVWFVCCDDPPVRFELVHSTIAVAGLASSQVSSNLAARFCLSVKPPRASNALVILRLVTQNSTPKSSQTSQRWRAATTATTSMRLTKQRSTQPCRDIGQAVSSRALSRSLNSTKTGSVADCSPSPPSPEPPKTRGGGFLPNATETKQHTTLCQDVALTNVQVSPSQV